MNNPFGLDLTGRQAVVTGGASGIGAACAARLAAAGGSVLIADLDEKAGSKGAGRAGSQACGVALAADSFDPDALAGRADVLVNCAGLQHVAPVHEFPLEKYRLLMTVMVEAPFRLAQAALPHMYSRGYGRIVNISSVHGLRASPYKAAYGAAKHGLEEIGRASCRE